MLRFVCDGLYISVGVGVCVFTCVIYVFLLVSSSMPCNSVLVVIISFGMLCFIFLFILLIYRKLTFPCYRFLKARKFDLDKTFHMWAEMLNWRKDNNVDSILLVRCKKEIKMSINLIR